jgi:sugar transferase (PEP-CTERM/EpsH1 system associated)
MPRWQRQRALNEAAMKPLIAHVVYRFGVGGLENGVVNLINRMPSDRWRHAVVSLTDVSAAFRTRIERDDVVFESIRKPAGQLIGQYPRLTRLFRKLQPTIVHTRNLAALEACIPAYAAAVPIRVHSEHGWDVHDLRGMRRRYAWIRRMYRPFIHRYIALSRDLEQYLVSRVHVPPEQIVQIYNGVDTRRFCPRSGDRPAIADCPFRDPNLWLVGTVGRMEGVKDPLNLARAFIRALEIAPAVRQQMRLVMIGDGSLRHSVLRLLQQNGVAPLAWLPGERHDVPDIMRALDCFVLPSLAEGISNTVLEAMASGLPVVATDVGGNGELIEHELTGHLAPAADPDSLAFAMLRYHLHPDSACKAGMAARQAAERKFALDRMIAQYVDVYEQLIVAEQSRLQNRSSSSASGNMTRT